MVKVLYIAGWGRSGTTILDNILGAYHSIFSVGEMYYLWRRGLNAGRHCGCGQPLTTCEVWSEILNVAYEGRKPEGKAINAIQRSKIRVRDTRHLWREELDDDEARYRDEVAKLYRAIAKVTGAQLIVDSSKTPPGAAIVGRIPDVEPYLLHMVRDPRAVAYSWTRPKAQTDRKIPTQMQRHSSSESTMSWLAWNLLTEEMSRGLFAGHTRQLRYEDFIADPQGTVASLLEFTGIEPVGDPFQDRATVSLGTNHTVSGNPGRFQTGPVVLRMDDAWRAQQSRRQRVVTTTMSLPLLRRYGYHLHR